MFWYLINFKKKKIGLTSNFILNIIKENKNIKILIINEKWIYKNIKNYNKNYYYKHSRYIGNYKKIYFKNCKEKEIIINSIKGMIKNNKIRKKIIKNIKFLSNKNLVKNLKNKILYF